MIRPIAALGWRFTSSANPAIALLQLILVVACAQPSTTLTVDHRRAMVDSVQTMLSAWREAINGRNFDRAASFYATDPSFRWYEDGELKYRSSREIGDSMRAMLPVFRTVTLSLIDPEVTPVAPGVAVITTGFAEKLGDTTGSLVGFAGAISSTVVHGDSGWKFLVGHTSSALPRGDTLRKPTH